MNPFDLSGYLFLRAFLLFGIAVAIVALAPRRSSEMDDGPRLATVSLADRPFLEVAGVKIRHPGGTQKKGSHPPVESAVLARSFCWGPPAMKS